MNVVACLQNSRQLPFPSNLKTEETKRCFFAVHVLEKTQKRRELLQRKHFSVKVNIDAAVYCPIYWDKQYLYKVKGLSHKHYHTIWRSKFRIIAEGPVTWMQNSLIYSCRICCCQSSLLSKRDVEQVSGHNVGLLHVVGARWRLWAGFSVQSVQKGGFSAQSECSECWFLCQVTVLSTVLLRFVRFLFAFLLFSMQRQPNSARKT